VDFPIKVPDARPIRADVVFTRQRLVVYVDGCFWHGCPDHWTRSRTNADYWVQKVTQNKERDLRNTATLEAHGWKVLRFWEHQDMAVAVESVVAALR
jgi:DNA mismatch endonuclease (patch repair protein)